MSTSRLLAPALAVGLLFAPAAALGQTDATPEAGSAAQSSAAQQGANAAGDPVVGSSVPYLNEEGDELGVVTIQEVTDPFEDFSEFFEVDEGSRYVAVEVTLAASEAAGSAEEPFEARSNDFGLQTTDGFFYASTFATRDLSSGDIPDLETIAIDPGDEVSGLVFYQIPAEAELARLLWQPESGRLLVVADLREGGEGNG